MAKVLVFGTFDIFHPGHEFFLKEAKKLGSKLIVVIARDLTVAKIKGRKPANDENKRLNLIKVLNYVDEVFLGKLDDKYKIILEIKPDLICIGYDQTFFVDKLEQFIKENNLKIKIIKFDKGLSTNTYKSSILRNNA